MTRFVFKIAELDALRISTCHRKRLARSVSSLVLAFVFAAAGNSFASPASPSIRLAVAPFSGEVSAKSVGQALAAELKRPGVSRLIAPGEFVAEKEFDPRASEVRRWAYNAAVDTIVIGRILPAEPKSNAKERQTRRIEASVRSGHSGAELSHYFVSLPITNTVSEPVKELATLILLGLGFQEPAMTSTAGPPHVSSPSANSAPSPDTNDGEKATPTHGSKTGLAKSGFRNNAPIEIKAEEAEIIQRGEGRRLIFQRNVRVKQDNIVLRSDRLEADYHAGESEPRRLIAEGRVIINQDDRHARCDQAVYQRDASLLTCKGHAELIQGCDIIRGESIEFDLAGDRARVEGAASIVIQPERETTAGCQDGRDPF